MRRNSSVYLTGNLDTTFREVTLGRGGAFSSCPKSDKELSHLILQILLECPKLESYALANFGGSSGKFKNLQIDKRDSDNVRSTRKKS